METSEPADTQANRRIDYKKKKLYKLKKQKNIISNNGLTVDKRFVFDKIPF